MHRLLVAIFLFTSLKCTTANAFAKQGLEKTDKDQISRAGQNQTLLIIINNPTFVGNDQSRALKYIFRATSQIHLFSRDPLSFKNWDWPFIVRCNGYIIGLLHFIVLQIDPESEEFQFRILIIFWSKLIYHISLWYFLVEVILKFWHNHI